VSEAVGGAAATGGGAEGRAGDDVAAAATFALAGVGDATSPALAFREETEGPAAAAFVDLGMVDATRFGTDLSSSVAVFSRSSDDFNTQPWRDTRTHPDGAATVATATVVPASSDATLRPVSSAFARTTAGRFPTRVVDRPFWTDSRARWTKPSIDTIA
jgi:hypothetical protein